MSLLHPFFHRTIKSLFIEIQEAGYENPSIESINVFREEVVQELEEGILPIVERYCYQNPSVKRNEKDSDIPLC